MAKRDKNLGPSVYASLALVGQLGVAVAVPIVLGVVAGNYLDKLLGAHGLVLIAMLLLGIVAGGFGAYRLLKQVVNWKQ